MKTKKKLTILFAALVCCIGVAEERSMADENVQILVQGGPFPSINGLYFGPDGNLWGASVVTPAIVAVNPETGEIVQRLTWEQGVKSPDDLIWGPDGSLYWVNILHGDVVRRYPDGTTKVLAQLPPGPDGITLSDDGRLFVSDCFFGNKLFEIDPNGLKEPRFITDRLGALAAFNAMDWGADGKLYGPRWFEGAVARLDVETGEFEDVATGLGVAAAVKFDSQGRLHAVDAMGRVWRINPEDGSKVSIAEVPATLDNFAFMPDGRIFVSNSAEGSITEVTSGRAHRTILPGGLGVPGGLTFVKIAGRETLVVPDALNLRKFDPGTGTQVSVVKDVESIGIGTVTAAAPHGENLLLASLAKNWVKLWDPREDRPLALFKTFHEPTAVVSMGDDFAIAELGSGSVVRVTPDLSDEMPIPDAPYHRTDLATGLKGPSGLAYANGNLYVTEYGGGRVLQVLEGGRQIKTRVVKDGLEGPEGLALADGHLYVLERHAGSLVRLDPGNGQTTTVATGLELGMPLDPHLLRTLVFKGVAVSGRHAWVSGDRGDAGTVIYKITLP